MNGMDGRMGFDRLREEKEDSKLPQKERRIEAIALRSLFY
jgi:hypothetical protein